MKVRLIRSVTCDAERQYEIQKEDTNRTLVPILVRQYTELCLKHFLRRGVASRTAAHSASALGGFVFVFCLFVPRFSILTRLYLRMYCTREQSAVVHNPIYSC